MTDVKGILRDVGKGGRVVIPAEICQAHGLRAGDAIEWRDGEFLEVFFHTVDRKYSVKLKKGKVRP